MSKSKKSQKARTWRHWRILFIPLTALRPSKSEEVISMNPPTDTSDQLIAARCETKRHFLSKNGRTPSDDIVPRPRRILAGQTLSREALTSGEIHHRLSAPARQVLLAVRGVVRVLWTRRVTERSKGEGIGGSGQSRLQSAAAACLRPRAARALLSGPEGNPGQASGPPERWVAAASMASCLDRAACAVLRAP